MIVPMNWAVVFALFTWTSWSVNLTAARPTALRFLIYWTSGPQLHYLPCGDRLVIIKSHVGYPCMIHYSAPLLLDPGNLPPRNLPGIYSSDFKI